MKYVYEIYENDDTKGRTFVGYKSINSDSSESARVSLLSSLPENYTFCQIWVPQGE